MNQRIIEEAMKNVNRNYITAINTANENKINALKNQKFKSLFLEYRDQVEQYARTGIKDDNLSLTKEKINNLLKELKIGPIDPQYSCKKCGDTGYFNNEYCDCLKKEISLILTKTSGIGNLENFDDARFDFFDNPSYMKKVYQKLKAWCNSNFKRKIIYLTGDTGTGKTHLLKCMANELINNGKLIKATSSYKMGQDFLKSYYSKDYSEKQAILNSYISPEVLFIDDLGTETFDINITRSYLYTIINERIENNTPTVITTNLNLFEFIERYGKRLGSRIADENTIKLEMSGEDLRLKKK